MVDSGATHTFLPVTYKGTNEQFDHEEVEVGCANGASLTSVAIDEIDLPSLPAAARECYKFTDIAEPLVSVRRIVESGYSVLFEETAVIVKNKATGKQAL